MENFIYSPPIVCCAPSVAHYLDAAFPHEKSQINLLEGTALEKPTLHIGDIHRPARGSNIDIVHRVNDSRFICRHLSVNRDDILRWIRTTSGTLDNNKRTILQMDQFLSQLTQRTNLHLAQLHLRESLLLLQTPPDNYQDLPLEVKSHPVFLWSIAKLKSVIHSLAAPESP